MSENTIYQTYLKDCDCSNGGIIIHEGVAVCRWCRTPYAKGGEISYKPEHFKSSHSKEEVGWEIMEILHRSLDAVITLKEEIKNIIDANFGNNWYISKVRRLSDNQTFSIGEKIDSDYNGVFTIKSIYLTHKYGMLQISGNNGDGTPTQVIPIQSASKLPERKVLLPVMLTWDEIDKLKELLK